MPHAGGRQGHFKLAEMLGEQLDPLNVQVEIGSAHHLEGDQFFVSDRLADQARHLLQRFLQSGQYLLVFGGDVSGSEHFAGAADVEETVYEGTQLVVAVQLSAADPAGNDRLLPVREAARL